ncbi:MAG: M15 family metallopeptidase [Candidatus Microsaccharimonas sp.]
MKKHGKKNHVSIGALVKKRRISIMVLCVALVAGASFLYWQYTVAQDAIAQNTAQTKELTEKTDTQLKRIKERKAAEEKARLEKEAAEKAAAAKEAAEQSIAVGTAGASTLNAKACNVSTTHTNPAAIDVMVNKKHCIQPLSFVPSDLVTSNGATLSAKAIAHYNQLFHAAAAAGQGFYVTSSYRSYGTQVSTYNYWVSTSGQAGADTYSARPGYSEHQTGLVFDVAANGCVLDCFGGTSQYQWLQQNAANYGFIQRYYAGYEAITGYKAEEWHYRYVGIPVAQDMKAKGIKTLEQYWNLPGGLY